MTIQLPILLWTVISFCVLMLVLDRLLFRPLLAFMDARSAKIARAQAAREAADRARQDAQHAAEEAHQAAEKRARDDAQSALEAARCSAAQETVKREQAYAEKLAETKTEMEAERQAMVKKLDAGMEELVSAFVRKLAQ